MGEQDSIVKASNTRLVLSSINFLQDWLVFLLLTGVSIYKKLETGDLKTETKNTEISGKRKRFTCTRTGTSITMNNKRT